MIFISLQRYFWMFAFNIALKLQYYSQAIYLNWDFITWVQVGSWFLFGKLKNKTTNCSYIFSTQANFSYFALRSKFANQEILLRWDAETRTTPTSTSRSNLSLALREKQFLLPLYLSQLETTGPLLWLSIPHPYRIIQVFLGRAYMELCSELYVRL